jgi:ATP-dependent DNA helicase RecQ
MNAYTSANEKKTGLVHPSLFYKLKKLRDDICAKKSLPIYLVASSKTLEEMTTYLPQNLEELEQIKGFGKAKIDAYGDGFLSIIKEYALENNLSSNISKLTPKHKRKESKQTKADTRAESFRLYEEGKTINEISQDRALTTQTIEGHLAHYVQNGFIEIEKLVSHEKVELICTAAKGLQSDSVAPIKEKLGAGVTWGEIRMVMAWLEYQKLSSHVNH